MISHRDMKPSLKTLDKWESFYNNTDIYYFMSVIHFKTHAVENCPFKHCDVDFHNLRFSSSLILDNNVSIILKGVYMCMYLYIVYCSIMYRYDMIQ